MFLAKKLFFYDKDLFQNGKFGFPPINEELVKEVVV